MRDGTTSSDHQLAQLLPLGAQPRAAYASQAGFAGVAHARGTHDFRFAHLDNCTGCAGPLTATSGSIRTCALLVVRGVSASGVTTVGLRSKMGEGRRVGSTADKAYKSDGVNLTEAVSIGTMNGEEVTHRRSRDEGGQEGEGEEGDGETHEEDPDMSSGGYRSSGSGGRDD